MNSKFYAKAGEVLKENEDYVKNTKKFIDDLLDNDGLKKLHDFLKGLKDFLDENKFLTPKQQDALDKIKGNLGRKK
ncbi:MAG TPA: hypothetical protein PLA71_00720 [Saccharofermentans sp.]|nr:hypothetical protein [Saccharofermentans sp.]